MNNMRKKSYRKPCMLKSRKAQAAESQFNWIFVLIVGAVILAFFVFIVIKQKAASEAKFSGKVTKQLNTILVGAKVSSGSTQEIPTPELSIRFDCNDYFIGPASQRLGNRVVFAPEFLEGNRLITWTLDWNAPFKVTSFLYLSSPTIKYYIIGPSMEDEEVNEFYNSLPPKMNKQLRTVAEFNNGDILFENDLYNRFILYDVASVGDSFNIPSTFEDTKISGLIIDNKNRELQFLQSTGTSLSSQGASIPFHEKPTMYGAVFTDNFESYTCLMNRAYTRLNVISNVYFEKLNTLAPEYEGTSCEGHYLNNAFLKSMMQATGEYPPNYGQIGDAVSSIESANTRLQLQSCPLIY